MVELYGVVHFSFLCCSLNPVGMYFLFKPMEIERETQGLSLSIRGGWGLWMAVGKAVRGRNSLELPPEGEPFESLFLGGSQISGSLPAGIPSPLWGFRQMSSPLWTSVSSAAQWG